MIPSNFTYGTQQVRTVLIDGDPAFIANDLCAVLEIRNPRDTVAGLDDDEKGVATTDTLGGAQQVAYVTEAGMYSLIMRSRKPEAKAFKRWITHEVLPTIRKTGSFSAVELTGAELMAKALLEAHSTLEARARQVAELAPKAASFDTFLNAAGDYDVRDAAQLLHREHGIDIGRTRLFAWLRENKWIDRSGRPYQNRVDRGLIRLKASTFKFARTNGEEQLAKPQVRITAKGLHALRIELGGGTAALEVVA